MRVLLYSLSLITAVCGSAFAECLEREFVSDNVMNSPVCIPENPQRIVVLDAALTLGSSVDLELPVVGAPMLQMTDKRLQSRSEKYGITSVGKFTEPNIEKILSLKPDLIIGSAYLGDGVYNMASQVAPTILLTTTNWKEYVKILAELGGENAISIADKKFADYDKRIAAIKTKMPDKTVSILRITNWDFQVFIDKPDSWPPFAVASEAGVKRTAYETGGPDDQALKRPDFEELGNLTGDILLYIIGGANNSDVSGRYEEVIENPLWKLLPAVQAGNVHRIDAGIWIEFNGFDAANRVLDEIEEFVISR